MIDDAELKAIVDAQLKDAIAFSGGELSDQREEAMKFYLSEPFGDEREGRSKVVLSDVSDTVEWMLPSLLRIFASGDEVVKFEPVGPEDEGNADQATDYVNWIFNKDNSGFLILYTWFKDALLQKNGVVKHWWEETEEVERETYAGLTDGQLAVLVEPDEVEVIAHTPMISEIGLTHEVVIQRKTKNGRVAIEAVPPEEFLISRSAKTIEDAPFTAHRVKRTRSELIEQGFGKDLVNSLPTHGDHHHNTEHETRFINDDTRADEMSLLDKAMEQIDVFECYIKVDRDEDGVAELLQVTLAGNKILKTEEADAHPWSSLTPIPMPHKFFGLSVADLVIDLQLIRSTIMRQILDNMYLTNNARVEIPEPAIGENTLDDLANNTPGGEVRTAQPGMMREIAPPPTWQHGVPMLEVWAAEKEARTGVTRFSQGLDPDALNQQRTAVEVNALTQGAQQRVELIARIFAETGVKSLFKNILALVTKYQDQAKLIRLRNDFVEVDPSSWRGGMDVSVNVGLGTGNKDQQQVFHAALFDRQMALRQAEDPELRAVVTPKNVFENLKRWTEAAGMKSPEALFTDPRPDDGTIEVTQEEFQQAVQEQAQLIASQMAEEQAQALLQAELQRIEVEQSTKLEADLTKERQKHEHRLVEEEAKAENKAELEAFKVKVEADQKEADRAKPTN